MVEYREIIEEFGRLSGHRFQLLTKRPEIMAEVLTKYSNVEKEHLKWRHIPENIICGTSICDFNDCHHLEYGGPLHRIKALPNANPVKTFLSIEPLVQRLDMQTLEAAFQLKIIDWVIVGGESGHKARSMNIE